MVYENRVERLSGPSKITFASFADFERHPAEGQTAEDALVAYVERLNKRDKQDWEITERYETRGGYFRALLTNSAGEKRRMVWNTFSYPKPHYWQKQ